MLIIHYCCVLGPFALKFFSFLLNNRIIIHLNL